MFKVRCLTCAVLISLLCTASLTGQSLRPPDTQPTVNVVPKEQDVSRFIEGFDKTFGADLKLLDHRFVPSNGPESYLVLRAQPLRDGYFMVGYDFDMLDTITRPRWVKVTREFHFWIGKKGSPRTFHKVYERIDPLVVANAGDTLLLPFRLPDPGVRYAFSTQPAIARYPDAVRKSREEAIAGDSQLPHAIANPGSVSHEAGPELILIGSGLDSAEHRAPGAATHSCGVLLKAAEAGTFVLEAVIPEERRLLRNARGGDPVQMTIVPADQPVTMLLDRCDSASGTYDYRFAPGTGLPLPLTLRVGDYMTYGVWSEVVTWSPPRQPPPVSPPRITLKKSAAATGPGSPARGGG